MDDSPAPTGHSGNGPRTQQHESRQHCETGMIASTDLTQTICILVFRGYPRDCESARIVDFCVITDDGNNTDTTYRLVGSRGSYGLSASPGQGNIHTRPHFVRQFHVATVPVVSVEDRRLHDLVSGTSIHNENPEWTRWTWLDNVLGALTSAGIITSDEAIEIIDATIDCVSSAPYPD
ncbi:hypothetical protein BKA67DRAFT_296953 [Truncatella angustata]|uniref:Uncharacterized protein n=1 Tax=Truncatella angustata TaxID=152316 RepID=A0A9P8UI66_9PEZI|nr:uncharacterized protein BKA67DRAFT_296953 [Truncatella angustata]KAH6652675.1 hypothetical protein BKA67DRAFT_296953 [Truncatella angustata]